VSQGYWGGGLAGAAVKITPGTSELLQKSFVYTRGELSPFFLASTQSVQNQDARMNGQNWQRLRIKILMRESFNKNDYGKYTPATAPQQRPVGRRQN
jgi:hypothetical protein